jgi:hypothetical protein
MGHVLPVRWLSVDGHYVDCHLGRMLLVCHLRCNVINVHTNVNCHLHRIVANSSISDIYVPLLLNVTMLNIVLRMSLTSHSYDIIPHKCHLCCIVIS